MIPTIEGLESRIALAGGVLAAPVPTAQVIAPAQPPGLGKTIIDAVWYTLDAIGSKLQDGIDWIKGPDDSISPTTDPQDVPPTLTNVV